MSYYDYKAGQEIAVRDYPFYALIQAAMRQADTDNLARLQLAFPVVFEELRSRYRAPGGLLDSDIAQGGQHA